MANATSSSGAKTESVDDIRRRMAQIRQRLHQDMQGVVAGAEAASDWKHYIRLYPWAALGVAFAAGFVVVPRRRRSVTKTAEKAAEAAVAKMTGAVEAVASVSEPKPEKSRKGLIGAAFGLLGPLALRYAQSYALGYVENWIAQQQAAAMGPTSEATPGGVSPGATRQPGM